MDGKEKPQGLQPAGGAGDVCTLQSCGTQGQTVAHGCISGLCFALSTQPLLSSGAVYLLAR